MDTDPAIGVSKSAKVDSGNVCGRHLIALKSGPQGRFYAENGPIGTFSHARRRGTVHEMARDEARHGRGLEGLLKRYFK